jgi:anti-sigma B factor antagonist
MAQLQSTYRDAGTVTVLDLSGRITLGEPSALLRTTIRELLGADRLLILVNLADVNYIDSNGIGELVSAFTTVKNRGGQLKLLHLTKKVHDLLQITKLYTVFDVHSDEREALRSFDGLSS